MTEKRVWNLTGRDITYDDGRTRRILGANGTAWVPQDTSPAPSVQGMMTSHIGYGSITGLPGDIGKGDVVILSTRAADYVVREMQEFCDRVTILCPNWGSICKRGPNGVPQSIGSFFRR